MTRRPPVHFTVADKDDMINKGEFIICDKIKKNPNINVFNNIFEKFLNSYDWQKIDYDWLPTLNTLINTIINSNVCKETIPEDAIEGIKYLKCVFDDIAKGIEITEYDETVMVWFIDFAKCWLNNEHNDLPYFNKNGGFF